MSEPSESERRIQVPAGPEDRPPERAADHETKFPRGLVIRLFAYLVAGHLFAGFLYLLFQLGGQQ
ncbi:DUF6126 family protein [Streptomyces sp. NPDC056909]|uniref:DUF6126 family protein n=1 Tax=unclassified Streptomyces TaxID=2593676 RepID=UPI00343B05E2|nr:DUF6126 family protein [Streptomyces sp. NBC_00872]